jgi:hypothetical protein
MKESSMKNMSGIKLLSIFLVLMLFSIKISIAMDSTSTDEENLGGGLPEIPSTGSEVTTGETETLTEQELSTEPETPAEPETITETGTTTEAVEEGKTSVTKPATSLKTTPTRKGAPRGQKITKTRPQPQVVKKGVISSKSTNKQRIAKKTVAKRGAPLSEIEKLAEFSSDGNIDSFGSAIDKLIEFIQSKDSFSPQEKIDVYASISKFHEILGKNGFDSDDHYDTAAKLFNAASQGNKLSKLMMNNISKWEAVASNKDLRKPMPRRSTAQKPQNVSRRKPGAVPTKSSSRNIR